MTTTRYNLTDREKVLYSASSDSDVKYLPCTALKPCGEKGCRICGSWTK